jgi:hypothetical protein
MKPIIPITVTIDVGGSRIEIDPREFDEVELSDPSHLLAALKATVDVAIDDAVDDWKKSSTPAWLASPRNNPHMPRHPRPVGPRGGTSEPQSILVPADVYTLAQAKRWVKHHGFKVSGFEEASERTSRDGRGIYHRFRQFDPDRRHSYRTISFGDSGIMAVVEVPKRK